MSEKKYPIRNRNKNKNLAGLYAVPSDIAMKNGKPRDGVYGYVTKDAPYICKAQSLNNNSAPKFVQDMTGDKVPAVLKNRMLAFYSDRDNRGKSTCYLVEKPLYLEMLKKKSDSVASKQPKR